ncbi:MAG: shikimate dehydrogenase [Planctomycetes bacterium]|nr:shikimate dehydrogenase [Planctomycetota bacterium]
MSYICTPIVSNNMSEAISTIEKACNSKADILELRLDYIDGGLNLPALLASSKLPVIVTCRAKREGGQWSGSEEERIAILQQVIDLKVDYVDVEADSVHKVKPNGVTKIIASTHNFESTPDNMNKLAENLEALPCDIIKWATMANSLEDNLKLFEVLEKRSKPAIGICMGELGEVSRILGPSRGSYLTFGSLTRGQESAPGQFTVDDLADLYRVKSITRKTKLYSVIGNPIAHSLSPEIHNRAFSFLDIDAVYFRLRVNDFSGFLKSIAEPLGLCGISVTIPHKHDALAAASIKEDLAEKIGAANTLTRIESGWHADNTDCSAALDAIKAGAARSGFSMESANALLLGAGGTARAIGFGLISAGCNLVISNRTRSKAEALASELGAEVMDLDKICVSDFSIIANTTSVGMHPNVDAMPVDASVLHKGMVVFDAVYNPRETMLLREAKAAGGEIASGVEMFVGQAARQFERWTGKAAPRGEMEKIVLKRLAR